MKILYIITGLRYGGAEKLLFLTCKHFLKDYQVEVLVVYFDTYAPMKKLFDDQGIKTLLMKRNLLLIPRLLKLILLERINVVHTHLIHADIFGRIAALLTLPLRKMAIFTTVHDVDWFRWQRGIYFSLVRKADYFLALPRPCRTIAISKSVAEMLVHNQHFNPKKIDIIYNAVEIPDNLEPRNAQMQNIKCLYLGRLVSKKNIACLLRAIHLLREEHITLTIVGEGQEEHNLHRQVQELGIKQMIQFEPATLDTEAYYLNHDIFILPSSYEGLGIVILEAFCLGLPVIGSNVHGIRELLANDRGLFFQEGNEESLANQIKMLARNPAKRRYFAQRGYAYVREHHNIDDYVRKLWLAYFNALALRPKKLDNNAK